MAKQVKYYNLVEVETGKTIMITTKTTTDNYFKKLINDYFRLGKFDSTNVAYVPA
jgi:hypothetical protein